MNEENFYANPSSLDEILAQIKKNLKKMKNFDWKMDLEFSF